jgi:hypothetical protein
VIVPRNEHRALDIYLRFSFRITDVKNGTGRIQFAFYRAIQIMKVEAKSNTHAYSHKCSSSLITVP